MFLFLVNTAFAAPVSVKIVDGTTGKVIPDASVHCGDSLTTKKISDENGQTLLECETGKT